MSDGPASAVARAADLLARGAGQPPGRSLAQRLRGELREVLLRVLRPYTAHQRQIDEAMLDALSTFIAQSREVLSGVSAQAERSERLEAVVDELVTAIESLRRRIEHADHDLRAELNTVPYVAGSPFARFTSPVGEVTGYRDLPAVDDAASPYSGFEDLFRGPAARVAELQRAYLPLVAGRAPVLDIGCGRGEFLALLAAEGIPAHGVDSDAGMVTLCREQKLPAELGDAIEHLDGLPDGSLGTVFSAQVIEHLPVAQLQRLLATARRKLRPDGLFIAETVNPHSLAGMKTFWVDLTHQHPIFPEVALAMCGLAGFAPAYVFAPGHAGFEAAKFTSNTYAVVAGSPAARPPGPER